MGTENRSTITSSIITDMAEGVVAIRYDGKIALVNDAALSILEMERRELEGHSFAAFFADERNDAFTEVVVEAVRNKAIRKETYVPYFTGEARKELRVVSSYLRDEGEVIGVVLVLSDITELSNLRDAVRAMEEIQALNKKLEIRNQLLKSTFGRYLSDDIVKEILDTPDGLRLGGQRKTITILMSDLRGFTMMCERMSAEPLITMLNHYFSIMYEEISRYSGIIIEFLGDGMFVIFGAPTENPNHASDAVACAVAMQSRMDEVNAWNQERGYETLSMGIGINTDAVILGNIGSEKRTKYGVLGPAVNLTGRIESCSVENQILISEHTRRAVKEELAIEDQFEASLKGVKEPVRISCVTGIGGAYQLAVNRQTEEAEKLAKPIPVTFRKLQGKSVDEKVYTGKITALSRQFAEICLDEEAAALAVLENLMIELGGDLYGKVLEEEKPGTWEIRITARPAGFDEVLKKAR